MQSLLARSVLLMLLLGPLGGCADFSPSLSLDWAPQSGTAAELAFSHALEPE